MGKPFASGVPVWPIWATTALSSLIAQPTLSKQQTGWIVEKPSVQYFNWILNNNGLWAVYFDDKTQNIQPIVLRSTSTATWNGSQLNLGAALQIVFDNIYVQGAPYINQISSGFINIANGDVVIVNRDYVNSSPVTLSAVSYPPGAGQYSVVAESSRTATNEMNEMILFRCNGTQLEIPFLGFVYNSGQSISFGKAPINSYVFTEAGAITWTINHNLGNINHTIQIFDGSGVPVALPDAYTPGANSDTIVFGASQAGTALLIGI